MKAIVTIWVAYWPDGQRPKFSGALLKERTMQWCVSQEADALHGQAIRRTKKGRDVVLDRSWHGGAVPGTSRAEGLRGADRWGCQSIGERKKGGRYVKVFVRWDQEGNDLGVRPCTRLLPHPLPMGTPLWQPPVLVHTADVARPGSLHRRTCSRRRWRRGSPSGRPGKKERSCRLGPW